MTKTDIIEELIIKTGFKRSHVLKIVDGFLGRIKDITEENKQVEIRGFGTFYRVEKRERVINSPIAGKKVKVPAKTVLGFKASKATERVLDDIKGA